MNRSTLPRPWGRATVEWTIWMCRSAATVVMWSLVKSLPWSTYRTLGKPCTAQAGSLLRQIAWRSARDRFNAEGAPEEDAVPGDRSGAVVQDDGQPGPGRMTGLVQDEDVQLGVVGLPDVVGTLGLTAVDELVP